MNTYTVVAMGPVGEGACLRDDSIVEVIEAMTPGHAAAKFRRERAKLEDQDPDIYEVLAVFEGAHQDEHHPHNEPEGQDLEALDRELEEEKREDAEIRKELGLDPDDRCVCGHTRSEHRFGTPEGCSVMNCDCREWEPA